MDLPFTDLILIQNDEKYPAFQLSKKENKKNVDISTGYTYGAAQLLICIQKNN